MNLIASSSHDGKPMASTGLAIEVDDEEFSAPPPQAPYIALEKERILQLVKDREKEDKPVLSLVVVGASSFPHAFCCLFLIFFSAFLIRSRRCWKINIDGASVA